MKNNNTMDILVQRQLEDMSSGNGAYLEMFLRQCKKAGLSIRLVFAPRNSFGNRPWSYINQRFDPLIDDVTWPESTRIGKYFVSTSAQVWLRFFKRSVDELRIRSGAQLTIKSYLGRLLDASESKSVVDECNKSSARYVVAEYSSMGPLLADIKHGTKAVLMHDLLSARSEQFRLHNIEPDFFDVDEETETQWVSHAELLVYASANEMQKFASCAPNAQSVWLRPEPQVYPAVETRSAPRIVFLGTRHAGNSDALQHFVDDIWPLVRKVKPTAEFIVAGSIGNILDSDALAKNGVKVLGRIDDLMSIAGPDNVGIAPTRMATGVSIKVAEYLMLGMPCVAYPQALEGFSDVLDDLVLRPINQQDFAKQLLCLLDDDVLRADLSHRALEETPKLLDNQELVTVLQDGIKPQMQQDESTPLIVASA